MNLEVETLGQPVLSLQHMLRRLSFYYDFLPQLIPDGTFGDQTLEAVMLFQREFHPPVTGQVDQGTWNAIRDIWMEVEEKLAQPRELVGFPGGGHQARPGTRGDYLMLAQAMFRSLGAVFEGIEPGAVDGAYRGAAVRNVQWLQRLAGLEPNGVLDNKSWDALSRLYEIFVVRPVPVVVRRAGRG